VSARYAPVGSTATETAPPEVRSREYAPLLKATVASCGLLVLAVVIFRRQLFAHWTFPWDFVGAYTTTPAYVAASVGSWHLPSWSPYVASGFPVAVDPQAGLYFPGWWALGTLGIPATLRVLTVVQVAHVLFGAWGVLALSRARRLGWTWAAFAAVAYLLFGGFYGEAEHADIVRGFAFLPWLLWGLTPPLDGASWRRLLAVPLSIWLIASGAYPGQLVSFGLVGLLYVGIELRLQTGAWRLYRGPLILAFVGSLAVSVAVLFPYLRADHAHELFRVQEPTAAVRAGESLGPRDLLGLFLNNFAWTYDGTVTSWAVGVPVLIGLACVRVAALRRHVALAVAGAVALALAMTPKIGFVGSAMTSLRPLFPSRFPAADYKAVVAVALVILAADSWNGVAARRSDSSWRASLAGLALLLAAVLAPSTYASPTRAMWLLACVIFVSTLLAVARIPRPLMVGLLMLLVIADGGREIYDYRLLGRLSPWQASPAAAAPYRARDGSVRKLSTLLEQAPASRPARVPPAASLASQPTGTDIDATGWIAAGYHVNDYGGTIEKVLWEAEHDQTWLEMLLAPWHAYTFACAEVGCRSGRVKLPPAARWSSSASVTTSAYGEQRILYRVNVKQPVLMIENELAIPGWQANSTRVSAVDAHIPLRAWRLSPGRYSFNASFHEPGRTVQIIAGLLACLAWLSCGLMLSSRRPCLNGGTPA
jgi:hypothetical protein